MLGRGRPESRVRGIAAGSVEWQRYGTRVLDSTSG